jgi:hypothetical protein
MTTPRPSVTSRVTDPLEPARLLALAARVEGDGRYNVAKVLRAAATARVQRDADERLSEAPRDDALRAELARVAAAMDADPLLAPLADPLRTGVERYAAGEVPLLADVGDPRVCRRCGHVVADETADPCPRCGSDPDTFLVQRPVWWLGRHDRGSALAALARTPLVLQALLERVPRHAWTTRPDPATWSPHEVIAHLRDAQGVLAERVDRILGEDDPDLAAQMVWSWNAAPREASTDEVMAAYLASRRDVLERLHAAPPEAWWRTGRHAEFGRLTLTQQVSYFAAHEPTHLRQVRAAAAGDGS